MPDVRRPSGHRYCRANGWRDGWSMSPATAPCARARQESPSLSSAGLLLASRARARTVPCRLPRSLQLDRVEFRRQDDFEQFAIVRIIQHGVLDLRRLQPARAFDHGHLAGAIILAFDPAFEHVDHLKFDVVIMPL